jgi:sulfate adenylyltransferase
VKNLRLRNANFDLIAVMTLDEVYHWDPQTEAALAYGSTDTKHPMVSEMGRWGKVCISGPMKVVNLPKYYDFVEPAPYPCSGARSSKQWGTTMSSPSRPAIPLHRIHEELTKRAAAQVNGSLLFTLWLV